MTRLDLWARVSTPTRRWSQQPRSSPGSRSGFELAPVKRFDAGDREPITFTSRSGSTLIDCRDRLWPAGDRRCAASPGTRSSMMPRDMPPTPRVRAIARHVNGCTRLAAFLLETAMSQTVNRVVPDGYSPCSCLNRNARRARLNAGTRSVPPGRDHRARRRCCSRAGCAGCGPGDGCAPMTDGTFDIEHHPSPR